MRDKLLPTARIGTQASTSGLGVKDRHSLPSPALVLDIDALDANIAAMATHATEVGVGLRPHAKAHKCSQIANRLIRAGAIGVSCATIDEAEAMAAGGLTGVLVTSPIAGPDMMDRLRRLLVRGADMIMVVDDPGTVDRLARVATATGRELRVLVEIDVGQGRTGCTTIESAVALANHANTCEGVIFAGVQAYWGHLQQAMPLSERKARVEESAARVREVLASLQAVGITTPTVTGGGTGTSFIDPSLGLFTEIQPGSFLFLDSCYGAIPLHANGSPFVPSLFVSTTVVSVARRGRVIVNAGFKAFATDSGRPVPCRGAPPCAEYTFMGDEHGAIDFDASAASPRIGDRIELLTSHCDPTVNLYSCYWVVRDDSVVDVWPVEARY